MYSISTLSLIRTHPDFRNFIIARSGLVGNALVLPLVVLLVFRQSEGSGLALGAMMAVSGLAALCSAYVWGKFADRSSRRLLITVGLCGALCALAAIAADLWLPGSSTRTMVHGLIFFLLAVVHQGTRVARKTYRIYFNSQR